MIRDPWYKVVTLRPEVREGRSFSPDEFAIALDQVVAGTAPPDYRDPSQFFSRQPSITKRHAALSTCGARWAPMLLPTRVAATFSASRIRCAYRAVVAIFR